MNRDQEQALSGLRECVKAVGDQPSVTITAYGEDRRIGWCTNPAALLDAFDDLQELNRLILSGLRWTGDGYEWTGAEYDYRLNPDDAVERMRQDRASLRNEIDRLRQFARRQAAEIEDLRGMADAVEVLRDIGKLCGCGHVDDPDGRRQLVNCIEHELLKRAN